MNDTIASKLHDMAAMLEVLGEDSFRASAHARAARAVEGLTDDIALLAKDKKALLAIEGIGPKLADKIIECVTTGRIAEHDELRVRVPAGLLEILALQGVGPKTVHAMWKTLGVDSIAKLRAAIDDGSLLTLPRMGEKAVAKIKDALAQASQHDQRLELGRAWPIAQRIAAHLRAHAGVALIEPAGSLRRGRETVGDLDIVVAMKPGHEHEAPQIMQRAREAPGVISVIASGETKTSLRVALRPEDLDGRSQIMTKDDDAGQRVPSIQVDVRVVPRSSFGAALQYFTGGKEHNVRLRALAQERGLTLNEWGLFDDAAWRTYHEKKKTSKKSESEDWKDMPAAIAGVREQDIYSALNLICPPPEMREDRGELALKHLPHLVAIEDIKAELHAHTTASDGVLSIEQLARAAHARGFHTLAVTDHSQSSTIARGLRPDRLREHVKAVRAMHARLHAEIGITILAGSEVDILADGTLDYSDDILALLDIVVASPHAALTQDPVTATKRLLKAIEHPRVRILGHPTGRYINRRKGLETALPEIYAAAKEHNVALEINAHWMRLDLRDTHVLGAVQAGCLIAINCDVHHPEDYDNLRYGVMTARRGWVTREQCVNAWEGKELREWLSRE